jgi:hypothetical protein
MSMALLAEAEAPAPFPLFDGFEMMIFPGVSERAGATRRERLLDGFVIVFGIVN